MGLGGAPETAIALSDDPGAMGMRMMMVQP